MSAAAAPALAPVPRRVVSIRLADVGFAIATFSGIFAVLLLLFPESFPQMLVTIWERGYQPIVLAGFTFALDAFLYIRIAYKLSAKPGILAAMCLGALPVLVVAGCSLLAQAAIHRILAQDVPNLQARIGEEVLAQTYLCVVSAVFLPFLAIRLLQQFKATQR